MESWSIAGKSFGSLGVKNLAAEGKNPNRHYAIRNTPLVRARISWPSENQNYSLLITIIPEISELFMKENDRLPPDVLFENYCFYIELLRSLTEG